MSDTDRVILTVEDFLARLDVKDGYVHTFRSSSMALIGIDWTIAQVEAAARAPGVELELSGPIAESMNHGVFLTDHHGPVAFATKPVLTSE